MFDICPKILEAEFKHLLDTYCSLIPLYDTVNYVQDNSASFSLCGNTSFLLSSFENISKCSWRYFTEIPVFSLLYLLKEDKS